ncbi:succinate-semialdehyde dehydrogenase GabD [Catenovulum agarivorans DS-2]|uniref:Succinate-semialdehyde dehydrogenase GabD n=1 Tax=Catenovulum agarivorans DS-2 TaxID=1328313 RepID=W7QWD7_9ALTE|nr:aldehyde dehydrogenase family protein [Catenovulum agarivorans]EWH09570.1 succinate-semialdehyde dehydrogenase GabD [Catenovulum agarivorans DS-2]
MTTEFKMLINGELVGAETTFPVVNPATEEVIAHVPDAEPKHIELALESADTAFQSWSKMSLAKREAIILKYVDVLEANKKEIIDILIAETGKPADNAEYDFGMLTTCLKFFIEEAKRLDQPVINDPDGRFHHFISRQPLGVVVGYLAWNFPLLNVGYKIGPSLAAGCAAIIKPSQVTPLASLKVAELAIEAGVPAGVLNVISSNNYDITDPLLTSDKTKLFTMIGSTRAGVGAMRTACTNVKHFSVELGGNAPVIVYDDADVEKAATDITNLKFANTGQVCVSPNRVFVHKSVYESFLAKAKDIAGGIKLAPGYAEGHTMGPMMSPKERERVIGLIEDAVANGAQLETGGKKPEQAGYYLQPTILSNVNLDMKIVADEIFGPVMAVIPFDDSDDIIALANDNEYGLSAYVYTTNLQRGMQAAQQIEAGSVCINEAHYSVQLPHGGLKQSGVGKDCSRYSLQEYLTLKRVSVLVND